MTAGALARSVGTGLFITFEGGEGVGKSTQARLLAASLEARGARVLLTREPGGSPAAERIRSILLDAALSLDPMTQLMLFSAARRDHWLKTIQPALAEGKIVLCDRFVDSTYAYQGAAGGLPREALDDLTRHALESVRPDLTLLLDLDPAIGLGRAGVRRGANAADSFEARDLAFHGAIRKGLLDIAARETDRFRVIDAGQPESAVARDILALVNERLRRAGAPA